MPTQAQIRAEITQRIVAALEKGCHALAATVAGVKEQWQANERHEPCRLSWGEHPAP